MRTEEHRPIRLQDYRPPDWLIETVDLDVSLHPTATTVRAKLKLTPNSAGGNRSFQRPLTRISLATWPSGTPRNAGVRSLNCCTG